MLTELVDNGHLRLDKFSPDELATFKQMCHKCDAGRTLGIESEIDEDNQKDLARFQLLRGEIVAGNDNPQIVAELRRMVVKFVTSGTLPRKIGNEILVEIASL